MTNFYTCSVRLVADRHHDTSPNFSRNYTVDRSPAIGGKSRMIDGIYFIGTGQESSKIDNIKFHRI